MDTVIPAKKKRREFETGQSRVKHMDPVSEAISVAEESGEDYALTLWLAIGTQITGSVDDFRAGAWVKLKNGTLVHWVAIPHVTHVEILKFKNA